MKTRNDLTKKSLLTLIFFANCLRKAVFAITEVDLKCEYRNSGGNLVPAFCMEAVVVIRNPLKRQIESGLSERLKAVSASMKSNLNF